MTLRLNGDSSGFTEIKAPNAAGDNSITLPTSNGGANQLLKNGGTAGELEYTSANGGVSCDNRGRLLIGTSSDITGTNDQRDGVQIAVANGGRVVCARDDDTVVAGNLIGGLNFYGNVGGTYDQIGQVVMVAGQEHTSTSKPTTIKFHNTPVNSTTSLPRLTILPDGSIKIGSSSPGIDFSGIQSNATGMSSETLDSYEEGEWSPQLLNNGGGAVTDVITANYTKIGNLVIAICFVRLSTRGTLTTSNLMVGNLPFQSNSNVSVHTAVAVGYFNAFANTFSSVTGTVQPNSTNILLRGVRSTDATGTANLNANDIQVNSEVILTATYHV